MFSYSRFAEILFFVNSDQVLQRNIRNYKHFLTNVCVNHLTYFLQVSFSNIYYIKKNQINFGRVVL
jgi:hypothetical protein